MHGDTDLPGELSTNKSRGLLLPRPHCKLFSLWSTLRVEALLSSELKHMGFPAPGVINAGVHGFAAY